MPVVLSSKQFPATLSKAMRTYTVDLHSHTPHVSGDYRGPAGTLPADLVLAALDAGIDVLAVSDHFSVCYAEKVLAAADEERIRSGRRLTVLPGAELKVRWRDDEVHFIAIFEPARAEHRFAALQLVLGMTPGEDPATLHRLAAEHDPVATARAIESLGGICHIAHADRRFGDYRLLDRPLMKRLLDEAPIAAVELIYSSNEAAVHALTTRPVCCISSSDAHSPAEMGRRRTELVLSEPTFQGLRDALRACALPV
jgi:predicted metal-dependent phosphoesterase TrpH